MNPEILNRDLELSDNPGLETTDPRLDEISTRIQQAQFLEAAELAEAILAEGIFDIRVVGFFVYGIFLEQGPCGLKEVFSLLEGLLRNNWAAFGPVQKREKHAQTSLRWFLNQLLKKFQYEENRKSDLWNQWTTGTSTDDVQEILDATEGFQRALGLVLEDAAAPVMDGLAKVVKWLQSFQQVVYQRPEPPVEAEAPSDEEYLTEEGSEERSSPPRTAVSDLVYPPRRTGEEGSVMVEGSYHLGVLIKKMDAFAKLVSEEKFPRAALVAEDINDTLANFDPRVFFPKLFARFSLLQALHINELASYEDNKQTMEWQALKEFYKVDLDSFIEF